MSGKHKFLEPVTPNRGNGERERKLEDREEGREKKEEREREFL